MNFCFVSPWKIVNDDLKFLHYENVRQPLVCNDSVHLFFSLLLQSWTKNRCHRGTVGC